MAYLVRKFHRPKWELNKTLPKQVGDLSADALTSCLRTSGNTLSVWKTDDPDPESFEDVLAAIFSGLDRPDRAFFVLLKESCIQRIQGVTIEESAGETPASKDINSKHRDIFNLNHSAITSVADIILGELRKGEEALVLRYNEKQAIDIVKKFVEKGDIDISQLSHRWVSKLDK